MTTVLRRRGALVVACLCLALVTAGVVFLLRAAGARGGVSNRAVVDTRATADVVRQTTVALDHVLSYDWAHPQVAAAAARTYLAGDAPAQYRALFAQLQRLAPGQHLTLTAKVVEAGVSELGPDSGRLLVFLDQQSTRASDRRSSVSAAQLQVGVVRHGGRWQITELHPL